MEDYLPIMHFLQQHPRDNGCLHSHGPMPPLAVPWLHPLFVPSSVIRWESLPLFAATATHRSATKNIGLFHPFLSGLFDW